MRNTRKQFVVLLMVAILVEMFFSRQAVGDDDYNLQEIARAIYLVRPQLSESKIVRYSKAIVKAAQTFQIEPLTLVAIAQQESTFRENLPEGKAGEIGMLQIRKSWLKNSKFRRVFKNAQIRDLHQPEKAFLYAAWILKDLRSKGYKTNLPYWTFYNARKFHHRFKYYLRVKRHLSSIVSKMQRNKFIAVESAGEWQPDLLVKNETSYSVHSSREVLHNLLSQINWVQKASDAIREMPRIYLD